MKNYSIKPIYKKSIIELNTWIKEIDGVKYFLRKESTYRWGEFSIDVPETDEEFLELAESRGYESWETIQEEHRELFDEDLSPEAFCLPPAEDDFIELSEDYDAQVEDLEDECACFFSVDCYGMDGEVDEDALEAMQEEAEEAYEEDWDSGIENLGWTYFGCDFQICSPITISLN